MKNQPLQEESLFEFPPIQEPINENLENAEKLNETDSQDGCLVVEHNCELLTKVFHYDLCKWSEMIESKQIDLSPQYQRRERWGNDRQSKLIESFFMKIPVPPIYLIEEVSGAYSIIDGKQRLTAIHAFISGQLCLTGLNVFSGLNGQTINELTSNNRVTIKSHSHLQANIVLPQNDYEIKYEVFKRLNTGGVALKAQEIRNSSWPGPTNNLIHELSGEPLFRRLMATTGLAASAVNNQMRDVEWVLRYFAFRNNWDNFNGGISRRLDKYLAENQQLKDSDLVEMKEDFLQTLRAVEAAFGDHAFRRYSPDNGSWGKTTLASLYDAQMFACRSWRPEQLIGHRLEILDEYQQLFADLKFRRSVDAATNTPESFGYRIKAIQNLLARVV